MENEQTSPIENSVEKKGWCCGGQKKKTKANPGVPCGAYGLAVLGAAVYFVQNAETFWQGVLGIGKAIVWPAILIYHLLGFLQL